jgi:hypothetical protein
MWLSQCPAQAISTSTHINFNDMYNSCSPYLQSQASKLPEAVPILVNLFSRKVQIVTNRIVLFKYLQMPGGSLEQCVDTSTMPLRSGDQQQKHCIC